MSDAAADEYWDQAIAAYEAEEWADVCHLCRAGLAVEGDHAALHWVFGMALQRIGTGDAALHHLREAIRLRPDFYDARYALVGTLANRDRPRLRREVCPEV